MDQISRLPDELIIHILSFLSIDEAASTSLLSKRWRVLFAFSPNLKFSLTCRGRDPSDFAVHEHEFKDFVDRVLALSGDSPVRRFTLKWWRGDLDSAVTNRWICNVLTRGVLDLHLDGLVAQDPLLLKVLACKTLVKVKLRRFGLLVLPDNASLPALKSLSLYFAWPCDLGAFEKLIAACPLLEELSIDNIWDDTWKLSHIVSRPTLKRLTIRHFGSFPKLGSMSFDNPSLVYLEYADHLQLQYPFVHFPSLVEAKIETNWVQGNHQNCDPSNLLKALRNVEFLSLSFPETVETFGDFHESVPVFQNLSRLSITTRDGFYEPLSSLPSLPSLLKKCPNLQTLVIQGPLCGHDHTEIFRECFPVDFCVVSSPVKVLEVTEYYGSDDDVAQMKRFLEDLSCLELVKVRAYAEDNQEKLRLATDLLMLPRASSTCKIQLAFFT